MVRSSSACFKIISCAGVGAGDAAMGELDLPQSKSPTDKRGWSFRKRSARHRVLSNSVSVEAPSGGDKQSTQPAVIESPAESSPAIPEKLPVSQKANETSQLSSTVLTQEVVDGLPFEEKLGNSELSNYGIDDIEESTAIVIQTAIRGYLAQRGFCKLKNAVKLQAVYRGHLVRRHAVGSLRCVQAIVKMQALVRARHARRFTSGQDISPRKLITDNKEKDSLQHEANKSCSSSTKKLLANGFARQLLETKSDTKHIDIKCDPSKPNSAWQWLERWVTTSESVITPSEITPTKEDLQKASAIGIDGQAYVISDNKTSKDASVDSSMEHRTSDGDDFAFHVSNLNPIIDNRDEPTAETKDEASATKNESLAPNQEVYIIFSECLEEPVSSVPDRLSLHSQPLSLGLSAQKSEFDREKSRRTVKRTASETMESEGKKFGFGLRKSPSPAFTAVQSKFEDLSSNASGGKTINSYDNQTVESGLELSPSHFDSATSVAKTKEFSFMEDSNAHDIRSQNVGSECGTELSVTSTLDSPDGLEQENELPMLEPRVTEKVEPDPMGIADETFDLALEDKANNSSTVVDASSVSLKDKANNLAEKTDFNDESVESHVQVHRKQEEPQSVDSSLDLVVQTEKGTDQPVVNLLAEDSPKGHIAVTDSLQGTPSSQVSVSSRRSESGNRKSKRHSQASKKQSPQSINQNSTEKNSTEHLAKDSKTRKGRNSFDHESRVSVTTNTLPNYMQATESARAKLQNHGSPKASPDVHEDFNAKKRHSLPATSGKQGSPRMQRSSSQAPQNEKGNGPLSPHAERRWVR